MPQEGKYLNIDIYDTRLVILSYPGCLLNEKQIYLRDKRFLAVDQSKFESQLRETLRASFE